MAQSTTVLEDMNVDAQENLEQVTQSIESQVIQPLEMQYRAVLQIASENGMKRIYDIPEAMAEDGATLHQMILYARGQEVRINDKPFARELNRGEQDFAEKLMGEMSRSYSILLIHDNGRREEVHGDYVSFQSYGAEKEGNIIELPCAVVVGGRTLGYKL